MILVRKRMKRTQKMLALKPFVTWEDHLKGVVMKGGVPVLVSLHRLYRVRI